jgi:hypothetical protein
MAHGPPAEGFPRYGIKRQHAPGDQSGDGRPGLLLKLGVVDPRMRQILSS